MAQYTKRGKGWQVRISWYDSEHKRHYKRKQGFKTKALAKVWATQQENQLIKGVAIDDSPTLADYYHSWFTTYKEPKIADITKNRYKFVRQLIDEYFKQKPLKEITRRDYQQFINWYGTSHAPESVKKTNSIIRACVQSAILDGLIYRDFTQRVTLTANKQREIHVEYLNLEEIKGLLAKAKSGLNPRYTSRYMIIAAIYTGARLSELQALTWKDIDWLHREISINKSWNEHKRDFKPTKNESSNRTIKANQKLMMLLHDLRVHSDSTMVFDSQFGTIPTSGAVNKTLRMLLSKCGYHKKNFHFHSLRHSHVALLLVDGVDIYAISKRLGHSDISTTANTYAYLIDEYKEKSDQRIITALDAL